MHSKSLKLFLFKPLEVALFISLLLVLLKLTLHSTSFVSWWLIGLLVVVVPVLFTLLFGAVYLLTWVFSMNDEEASR